MTECQRSSDLAYEAACRIVSPKEIRVGVSLLCALVLMCLGLWQSVNDLKAWRDVHSAKLANLEAESAVADALDRLTTLIEETHNAE